MSFSATASVLGNPDFGLVHIDPIETAKAFQTYLDTASKLTGVSLEDINRSVVKIDGDGSSMTLVDLLNAGMKLFDAVVWLTAGRPKSHPLEVDPGMKKESISSLHDVARSVFYCYFMLIVQARYPVSSREKDKPKIPNFLKSIMGMDQEQHVYVERICSFEPQKFDPSWAEHVQFKDFGQEVLSRFGLGVAGYRYFGPFASYQPKDGLPQNIIDSFNFARNVATAPASWDIHPLTRNPDVLTKRGNLNKNLGNLILDCFSEKDIEEMTTAKMIFKKPEREPTHRNYLAWKVEDDISGSRRIFRR
jgi:hypothetical protein